jgi:integrase
MASISKIKSAPGAKPWKAQVNIKGFKRVSRRFLTEKDAKAWAEPLERELVKQRERGGIREDVATLTIGQLAKEYLADRETMAQKAFNDRSNGVEWWVNNYGAERVMHFNVLKIRAARDRLQPGRANATVNRYLAAMRAAWNWGRSAGLVSQDLRWPSRLMLTEPKGRTRYLTDDEISALLDAAKKQGDTMYAAVVVSIACGVRKGELLRLKWSDVDFKSETIRILITKNSEARAVYLPSNAADALKALKASTVVALGASVFITETGEAANQGWIEYKWRSVKKDSGLSDFRWHDLRHSCASILAQHGSSLPEIGSVLGHQSASATYRYSHLIQGKVVKGHDALNAKLSGK